jgi:cation transport regulator
MPDSLSKVSHEKRSSKAEKGKRGSKQLSARTEKQIDSLPAHAKRIYKRVHDNAIEQYQNPEKRRGGEKQSAEEVAHKAAWAAVKRDYTKKGDKWVKK